MEIMIATILDPRIKKMQFGDDNLYERIKKELAYRYSLIKTEISDENSNNEQSESSISQVNLNQTYKRDYISTLFKKNVTNNVKELESYFNESQIDWDANLFLNGGICINQISNFIKFSKKVFMYFCYFYPQ